MQWGPRRQELLVIRAMGVFQLGDLFFTELDAVLALGSS